MKLNDFKVLTFDCYGTLIDWESGIWDAMQPLLMTNARNDITRAIALEAFARTESQQERESPAMLYAEILENVHRRIAEEFELGTTVELDGDFGRSVQLWPAFPDTADSLRYLKSRYKLVILSNISRAGFAASNRKLGVEFDAIYTAQDIGSYKPDPANFEYLLEHLKRDHGLAKSDILHTAQSLFHDHALARQFGIANAWIDRQRLSDSGDWGATAPMEKRPPVDFSYYTMREFADAVKVEWE